VALDLSEEVEAAHLRHTDIGDRGVIQPGADRLERFRSGADALHLVAPLSQGFLQEL